MLVPNPVRFRDEVSSGSGGGGDLMGVVTRFLDNAQLRKRTGMYVGADTGTALYYFLVGFSEGVLMSGKFDHDYEAFQRWLQIRLGDKNWLRVCLVEKGMGEAHTREFFFDLWDEFRALDKTE